MFIDEIIKQAGGRQSTAKICNVTDSCVCIWARNGKIPPKYWPKLATVTGIAFERIRKHHEHKESRRLKAMGGVK